MIGPVILSELQDCLHFFFWCLHGFHSGVIAWLMVTDVSLGASLHLHVGL